jgi:hypothetical protein
MQVPDFTLTKKLNFERYEGMDVFLKSIFISSDWNVDRSDPQKYISGLNSAALEDLHSINLSRVLSN